MIVKPDIEEFAEYPYAESATLRVSRAEYQILRTAIRGLVSEAAYEHQSDMAADMLASLNSIKEEMTNS